MGPDNHFLDSDYVVVPLFPAERVALGRIIAAALSVELVESAGIPFV